MKKILLVPLAVMIIAALIFAGCAGGGGGGGGTVITPAEVADHLGETVTVCGPCVMVDFDKMAPIDPKPLIIILGKLGVIDLIQSNSLGKEVFLDGFQQLWALFPNIFVQKLPLGRSFVGIYPVEDIIHHSGKKIVGFSTGFFPSSEPIEVFEHLIHSYSRKCHSRLLFKDNQKRSNMIPIVNFPMSNRCASRRIVPIC